MRKWIVQGLAVVIVVVAVVGGIFAGVSKKDAPPQTSAVQTSVAADTSLTS